MVSEFPRPVLPGTAAPQVREALQIPAELAGTRLDAALARLLPRFSRSRLQQWIDAGQVLVNGRARARREKVLGGEAVTVEGWLEADTQVNAEVRDLAIVHRDAAVIVIDKPAGLVVHPGAGNRAGTLQNALLAIDSELALVPRAGIVHRLDKDTSGLLVIARTVEAHFHLVRALAAREVHREYLALCVGAMTGGGTVDAPIGRHPTQRIRMAVRPDGRVSITHYRIERRFAAHTLARVQLDTGRTHQIRVHMAHVGYPLVGDPVYGGRKRLPRGATPALIAALDAFRRQALHATRLGFEHPTSGKAMQFDAPLPADFQTLLAELAR